MVVVATSSLGVRWPEYPTTVPPAGAAEHAVADELNRSLVLSNAALESLTVDAVILPTDTALTHGESALSRRLAAAAGPLGQA